jgi:hypothetical protein
VEWNIRRKRERPARERAMICAEYIQERNSAKYCTRRVGRYIKETSLMGASSEEHCLRPWNNRRTRERDSLNPALCIQRWSWNVDIIVRERDYRPIAYTQIGSYIIKDTKYTRVLRLWRTSHNFCVWIGIYRCWKYYLYQPLFHLSQDKTEVNIFVVFSCFEKIGQPTGMSSRKWKTDKTII